MVRDWPAKFVVADVPPANSAHLHVGAVPSSQFGIALGSDGALWFTEGANNKIGRITTAARSPSFRSRPRTTPRMGSRRGLTGRCGSPSSPTRSGGSPPLARSGEFPLSTTAGRIRSWRGLTGRCGSPTPTPRSGGSRPTAAGRPRPSPPTWSADAGTSARAATGDQAGRRGRASYGPGDWGQGGRAAELSARQVGLLGDTDVSEPAGDDPPPGSPPRDHAPCPWAAPASRSPLVRAAPSRSR